MGNLVTSLSVASGQFREPVCVAAMQKVQFRNMSVREDQGRLLELAVRRVLQGLQISLIGVA